MNIYIFNILFYYQIFLKFHIYVFNVWTYLHCFASIMFILPISQFTCNFDMTNPVIEA